MDYNLPDRIAVPHFAMREKSTPIIRAMVYGNPLVNTDYAIRHLACYGFVHIALPASTRLVVAETDSNLNTDVFVYGGDIALDRDTMYTRYTQPDLKGTFLDSYNPDAHARSTKAWNVIVERKGVNADERKCLLVGSKIEACRYAMCLADQMGVTPSMYTLAILMDEDEDTLNDKDGNTYVLSVFPEDDTHVKLAE